MITERKQLALAAAIMGSFVAGLDATVVNVALPSIRDDLGGGLAGQQWVSNAYLLTLGSLILVAGLAGRPLRRAAGVLDRRRRVRRRVGDLRAGADDRGAGRRPRAAGRLRRAADAERAGGDHRRLPARRARRRDRLLDRVVGHRDGDRAAGRRLAGRRARPGAGSSPSTCRSCCSRSGWSPIAVPKRDRRAAPGAARLARRGADRVRPRRPGARADPPARVGWSSPQVWAVGLGGIALLGAVRACTSGARRQPMLPLELFKRRNFAFGNLQTFSMYGGLGAMFFFLTLFLQQVAGYDALQAGIATIPTTLVMFSLSKRAGRLADRFGPRCSWAAGRCVAAVGIALMLRAGRRARLLDRALPGAAAVLARPGRRPSRRLTATVLADADESNAGIASGVNNAIARVAGAVLRRRDRRGGQRRRRQRTLDVDGLPTSARSRSCAVLGMRRLCARRRARPHRHPQPAPRGPLRGLRLGSAFRPRAVGQRAGGRGYLAWWLVLDRCPG